MATVTSFDALLFDMDGLFVETERLSRDLSIRVGKEFDIDADG